MRYDFIIVGAGSSGAVLASRLSEDPACSVLLLEAGELAVDERSEQLLTVDFGATRRDWGLEAIAQPGRVVPYPQGRAAGGGSAVNGAIALRGLPEDYDAWEAAGNPGWGWRALLPCFRRLESDPLGGPWHGAAGPLPIARWTREELVAPQRAFLQACREQGLAWVEDHNDPRSRGVGVAPMNRSGLRRVSTARAYIQPALRRPNLALRCGALVGRVLLDGRRAVGAEYLQDGALERAEAGEVLVCAGAIHSPLLLWRSGVGPAADLRALELPCAVDLPGVGENLMEHPGAFLLVRPERGACSTDDLQFQLLVRCSSAGGERNDLQLSMLNHWDLRGAPELARAVGEPLVFALTCGVQSPRSRGRVFATSADPRARPRIELHLLQHPDDLARLCEGLRRCHALVRSGAFEGLARSLALLERGALDDPAALGEYARRHCVPWYHAAGTCRMGPSPADGAVVDAQGRVYGVPGLRVFDASIMPSIPRANTNLTCIAIGERAAEILGG